MECTQKLLLLIALVILGSTFGCFGCLKEEHDALLHLKSVINYPYGNSLSSWNEQGIPSNCCNWERVSCGNRGQVISLSLDSLKPSMFRRDWYLNASIFLPLKELQALDLSFNSITGWTKHLTELSYLKELHLQFNKISGIIDVYSSSRRSKLKILILGNIAFRDPNLLLRSLVAFPSLKYLYLMNNDFRGAIKTHVLQALSPVELLFLSGSSLSQDFLQSIGTMVSLTILMVDSLALNGDISSHEWLCQLKKLQRLDISQNGLKGQLPLCFGNLTSIKYLDLRQNNFHGELPLSFSNLTSLQFFDLSSNQIVGNIASSPLTKLTSLNVLSLSNNKFQIPQTFKSFFNHSSLKVLWLDGNTFVQDFAPQPFIPKFELLFLSLSNCHIGATPNFIVSQYNLSYLDLSHNNIGGSFPSWILENNTHLVELILTDNLFIGSLHLSRHPHFNIKGLDVSSNSINYLSTNLSQSLPNLVFLNFSSNLIKGITPSNFHDMEDLIFLDLSYNRLVGKMSDHFFKHCFSLEILILSYNNLEAIPSLSNSSSPRILRLNDNKISGTIPSSLFSTTSLVSLDISNNHLVSQIPKEICNLGLILLDFSNNNLSGSLPLCFNTQYLRHVHLNRNKLEGPILHVFKNSTSLVTLDLGDNLLKDVIPKWIGGLYNTLSVLSLRNNLFEGNIPNQLCSLYKLTILDLSNNNISGQIPYCLAQMSFQPLEAKSSDIEGFLGFPQVGPDEISDLSVSEFNYLDSIHQGDFSVRIAMELTTKHHTYTYVGRDLEGMSEVDLSCNKLSGEIPAKIGSMIGVRALNLSHNELTGSIPSTLSKLSQIESLDLSYNNLNGSIPSELIQLNALAVFTVEHNILSGRIPEPEAQFATFGESSYEGNKFLCELPLANDCSTSSPGLKNVSGVNYDGSMDMDVFYECFTISSVIMFITTIIVLYINPHWRKVWFRYGEMWSILVYYFIIDTIGKAWKQVFKSA